MNVGGGAGLQAQELSDWTLAVLEKVQSGNPLHIPDAWLVHPQERLRPLRLRLILLHTNSTRVLMRLIVWLIKASSFKIQKQLRPEQWTMTNLCSVGEHHGTHLRHCHDHIYLYLYCFSHYTMFQSSFMENHDVDLLRVTTEHLFCSDIEDYEIYDYEKIWF